MSSRCVLEHQLAEAGKDGNLSEVMSLLREGASGLYQAMSNAALCGHRDVTELFLDMGIVPNKNTFCMTCIRKNYHIIDLFIEKGLLTLDKLFIVGCAKNSHDVVNFVITRKTEKRHHPIVEFFCGKKKPKLPLADGYEAAHKHNHQDMMRYLEKYQENLFIIQPREL